MEAERLADRSATTGTHLLDWLRTLMNHQIVGDVRGKGLLPGVELVTDRATKEPVSAAQITSIVDFCRHNGLIVGPRRRRPKLWQHHHLVPTSR